MSSLKTSSLQRAANGMSFDVHWLLVAQPILENKLICQSSRIVHKANLDDEAIVGIYVALYSCR